MTYYCDTGGQGTDPESGTNTGGVTEVTAQNSISGVGATSDNATIISRMQQRRGLKQDLPQPLRPGEIGFTTDSQQVFIGADPEGAPSFNKTSVFENTLNSRVLTESLLANQVFEFRLPFYKVARGESTGMTETVGWLPTSFYKTGVTADNERVFSNVVTDANTVFDVRDGVLAPRAFVATDLVVKRDSIQLEGNNTAQYNSLIVEDYTFSSQTTGSGGHTLTFRTRPEPSNEITVSYYDDQVVPRVLQVGNNAPAGNPDAFLGFYQQYEVPTWDQIDPELITYSDTTGRGFLGLEFKHISVRAEGNAVPTPNNVTLGTLLVSRNSFTTRDSGNITRSTATDPIVNIPVGAGHEFSNVGPRSSIVVSAGSDFQLDEDLWIDGRPLSVVSTTVDTVQANIALTGVANRTGVVVASASPNTLEMTVGDDTGLIAGDTLFFYGGQSSVIANETANVISTTNNVVSLSVDPAVYVSVSGLVNIPAAEFVNYGANVQANVVQIVSPNHGLTLENSPEVIVTASTDTTVVPLSAVTTQQANVDHSISGSDWYYIEREGGVTQDLAITYIPDEPLNYGLIAVGFSYLDDLLAIDLSGASTLAEASAIVTDQDEWARLILRSGDGDQTILMQNPAYDSTGREFVIYSDIDNTPEALGLTPGIYTLEEHTRRSQLERWFQAALNDPNLPLFNQVNKIGFGSEFYAEPGDVTSLGTYEIDIDETFNEIRFGSREEAIAFNTVVNNLYFRANNSDIRGLVNIKSNLELEVKQNIVIGDKTTTFIDMNVGSLAQTPGFRPVPGLEFYTSDYNAYVIEYTVQEADNVQTVPGANYARIGRMMMVYRRNFDGFGTPTVSFYEDGSEIVDSSIGVIGPGGEYTTESATLTFRAEVDPVDPNLIQVFANNITGWPLVIKYIVRRWNSAEIPQ